MGVTLPYVLAGESLWLEVARGGSRWFKLARRGSTWRDVARGGSSRLEVARRGSTWRDVARGGLPTASDLMAELRAEKQVVAALSSAASRPSWSVLKLVRRVLDGRPQERLLSKASHGVRHLSSRGRSRASKQECGLREKGQKPKVLPSTRRHRENAPPLVRKLR